MFPGSGTPCPDRTQGACTAAAKGSLPPTLSRTPGDPGAQVAFTSDLPRMRQEGFGAAWVLVLAVPLTGCVALVGLLNFYEPRVLSL